jgi:polysaccharide biosynthesis protein PslH
MNILFVVPYVPNLIRGRSFNFIRSLSERGHRITVLTLWSNKQEEVDLVALKEICAEVQAMPMPRTQSLWNCLQALPGKLPLQSVYSWQPALVKHLDIHAPYDVVHVEHLRGSRFGLHIKAHTPLPVVWDSVDCITYLFEQTVASSKDVIRRWRSGIDLERTRWYEGWLLGQFDHVLVTSPKDKAELEALSSDYHAPISVVPIGVDLEYFTVDRSVNRDPATLVLSGKMSYHANITMATYMVKEILPRVWSQRPDVKLMIVGKDPTREVQALAADPRIKVTGMVPHVPPFLRQATIAITPLTYGAGMQYKVLEAMACETPVVATPKAIAALQVTPGQEVVVADKAEDFAGAILQLLSDAPRREALGRAGRQYVETHHKWANIAQSLEAIYNQVTHAPAEATAVAA